MKMKAAILYKPYDLRIEEIPIPKISNDQVLIKIKSVGICGSDIHYYKKGRIGDFIVKEPFILGHECSGDIVQIGKNVSNVKEGDRVAIEPGIPCFKCRYCREGRYNLCPNIFFFATPPDNGSFCEYVAVSSNFVFPLPENVSYEEGAMLEPLSVGIFAVRRAKQNVGDVVVILGAGTIGLMILQAARVAGAGKTIITDVYDKRLEIGKELGASLVINVANNNLITTLNKYLKEDEVDVIYDAVGISETASQSVDIVRPGGTIVCIGLSNENTNFPLSKIVIKEIDLRGMFRYANTYPPAIRTLQQGLYNFTLVITRRVTLQDLPIIMKELSSESNEDIKVIVNMSN